jgi:hypothetical protein
VTIKKGEWWKGSEAADLDAFLRHYRAGGYRPNRFVHVACSCGSTRFRIHVDTDEGGVVGRECEGCGEQHLMLDSEEQCGENPELEECACPCGAEVFELAVGFAHRPDKSVKWVAVAGRCCACGILGTYEHWKIDYSPTEHLYACV